MQEIMASAEATRLRSALHELSRLITEGVRAEFLQEMIADTLAVDMTAPDPNLPPLTPATVQDVIDSLQNLKLSLSTESGIAQPEREDSKNEVE